MATKKKAPKPAKKVVAKKPAKKVAAKKAVAKKPAKHTVAKKAKPTPKAAKKPAVPVKKSAVKAAPKKPVAKKAAPKAKPAPKAVKKATPKPAAKAAKKAAPAKKSAPAPKTTPVKSPAKTAGTPKSAKKVAESKTSSRKAAASEATEPKSSKPLVTQGAGPNMPRVTPMVKKVVSTLEAGDKERYSDSDLEEFRKIIMTKLDEARKDYDLLKQTLANTDTNGTEDTSPSFKMIEDGSETLGREETAQLAGRQEKFIKHLEEALLRIRNKTYGICRITGKLISKERLRLVPHATLSIEAKQQMNN
jgi:RNA polymerase-binding transcription factor DksA